MSNPARGEVTLEGGGETHTICLTLGALAEIEAGLGVSGFAAMAERLKTLSAADLALVLAALMRGGGAVVDGSAIDPVRAAKAVADCFERAL